MTLLWDVWPAIEGKTAVTVQELEQGKQLAEHLTLVVGLRERAPTVAAEASLVRHQALTLLVRSYGEVRRALTFLRWKEGDAETVAPTLYARPRKAPAPAATPPAPAPATPARARPAPAVGAATTAPAAVEHGMPGGSPFVS